MLILVDTKNLARYGGGISQWFSPLLAAWIVHRPDSHFLLVGPLFDTSFLPTSRNWRHVDLPWPEWLPRPLRHPWYDNVLFPLAVSRLRPDLVFSPYHDVRMPRHIQSVITVHDLCLDEMKSVYPFNIRAYYLSQLCLNLARASFIITVSDASRIKLVERYGLALDQIAVVPNMSPLAFKASVVSEDVADFRNSYNLGTRLLFYPGGSEFRKNVIRMVQVFAELALLDDDLKLLVTGQSDSRWISALALLPDRFKQRIIFVGRLNDAQLRLAYISSSAVVYPSLCEGFGRVCLEAMETGTPLACSDLPVMREVAGDYPHYFNPYNVDSMRQAITTALSQGRCNPVIDQRFQSLVVVADFLRVVDQLA